MTTENQSKHEQVIWEAYLEKCKEEGKTPSPQDFAKWARTLMTQL